jgi:hypothetical protein
MSNVIERFEDWLIAPTPSTRRRFLVQVARGAFGLVAGVTGSSLVARAVAAGQHVQCCFLEFAPNYCPGSVCPSGCSCYTWTCCSAGGCRYTCGECYTQGCSYIQERTVCAPGGHCPLQPA